MRPVRCRKCGAVLMYDETMLENMHAAVDELNEKALKAKPCDKGIYLQQAAQIQKFINQANHRITMIEEKRVTKTAHLYVFRKYLLDNGIMTEEQIDELYRQGDEYAAQLIRKNERELKQIYCSYSNFTKRDDTAIDAIRNIEKQRGGDNEGFL